MQPAVYNYGAIIWFDKRRDNILSRFIVSCRGTAGQRWTSSFISRINNNQYCVDWTKIINEALPTYHKPNIRTERVDIATYENNIDRIQ